MKLDRTEPDLETLVGRIKRADLDLQPEFQRGEIWDKKRQQRLIDTILRRWYVPAVHVVATDNGQEVLDGQQRLAAVRDFFDNKIRVDGYADPPNEKIRELDGMTFERLPVAVKRAVQGFVIPVIILSDYEPDEPNELFFRLNQSYNLTPPEKRNALHGPARDQVRLLVRQLTDIGLLDRGSIGFNNNRLAYDDIISRACVSVQMNSLRKHINNDVVESFYRERDGFDKTTMSALLRAGEVLQVQINASGTRVKFNKGTLQSWLLYCARAENQHGRLPETLLSDFEADRLSVRRGEGHHEDGELSKVLALYDDRASYRVTDVSSVLIRDLSIHLYSQIRYATAPIRGSDVLRPVLAEATSNAQPEILDFLEKSNWGEPFLDASSPL